MSRAGTKKEEHDLRRCLVNGSGHSRLGLIRFTIDPNGKLVPDILERLGGRGAWVSAERLIVEEAIKKNMFDRAFKTKLLIDKNILEQIETQLAARLISLISLARKSGEAVSGADRVGEWLAMGNARIMFQASDGSEREKRNIGDRSELEACFECLNRFELGQAFGREFAVHVALSGHGLTNRVYGEANRLVGIQNSTGKQ